MAPGRGDGRRPRRDLARRPLTPMTTRRRLGGPDGRSPEGDESARPAGVPPLGPSVLPPPWPPTGDIYFLERRGHFYFQLVHGTDDKGSHLLAGNLIGQAVIIPHTP